ncbi:hypothetical protein VTN77DRAFT_1482 [Rasamsonia byssochlamydoides]|uniref:uncharacterized protein n=1 Tax=Rasamsonia byssochlamydoides TaxID=89139 RepID=UPI00374391AF
MLKAVLVKDARGEEYITVATHGFPLGKEVYHPDTNGVIIADIERHLGKTDISLARLRPGFRYENVTFESDASNPIPLTNIRNFSTLLFAERLYMDNSFTGYLGALLVLKDYCRIPVDDSTVPKYHWVWQKWMYLGQRTLEDQLLGSCGSPIWDRNGDLVGFFRYLITQGPMAGWAVGVPAKELENFGFALA